MSGTPAAARDSSRWNSNPNDGAGTMRTIMAGLFLVAAAAAPAQTQSAPEAVPGGAFIFAAGHDALDDTDTGVVLLPATDNPNLVLTWVCRETTRTHSAPQTGRGTPTVWFAHPWMGGDRNDKTFVRHRFDAEPASEVEHWSLASHTISIPQNKHNEQFTEQARGHRQVVVRITDPLDRDTETGTFPLDGIAAALSRLSCVR